MRPEPEQLGRVKDHSLAVAKLLLPRSHTRRVWPPRTRVLSHNSPGAIGCRCFAHMSTHTVDRIRIIHALTLERLELKTNMNCRLMKAADAIEANT